METGIDSLPIINIQTAKQHFDGGIHHLRGHYHTDTAEKKTPFHPGTLQDGRGDDDEGGEEGMYREARLPLHSNTYPMKGFGELRDP